MRYAELSSAWRQWATIALDVQRRREACFAHFVHQVRQSIQAGRRC